jgi:acyl carrier protein
LINRGGEKISPLEIDQALMKHPAVAQAAAFGVPHPRLGEDVAAAVVLHPGAAVTPAELREFISDQVATFKMPRRITIVDQLPKGITGKVQRKRLSEALRDKPEREAGVSEQGLHDSLLELWKRMLKIDSISLDDDFFEKGGDSLLAMDVSLELQKLIGRELPESILFEAPTIRDLAKRLSAEANQPA